ncbi:MAG: nucleotidyl transferase AbiEii/AbiGii toxin family protein, partial [Ktedonobacterales bacterium]|nr:nucleotidyl transferase AbiEii/AbiGii toxin family protein [Ktedonobacterales bacterium]
MRVFPPHLAVLPPEQQAIWPQLAALPALGFVLYGGTAIVLRLGHRTSVDFDCFNDLPLDQRLLKQRLPLLATAQTIQDAPDTWTVQVASPNSPHASADPLVKISFFGGIDVGRIGEPEMTADGVLAVASPEDLLAH